MDELPVNGGLQLPQFPGAGEIAMREAKTRWHTYGAVEAKMKAMLVPDILEPTVACPAVTAEMLLTPDIREYTTVYAAQRTWYGYATRTLAVVNAHLLEVQNELEYFEATTRRALREGQAVKLTAQQVQDQIITDPYHVTLKLEEQEHAQHKLILAAWIEDLYRALSVVSRQIEIRKEDHAGGKNEQNQPDRAAGKTLAQVRGGSIHQG